MEDAADTTDDTPGREQIEAVIGANPPDGVPGALLNGWVVIAEWVDPDDGQMWLTRMVDSKAPSWRTKGLLFEVLNDGGT